MTVQPSRARRLGAVFVALLLAATATFAVGVSLERRDAARHAAAEAVEHTEEGEHTEGGEGAEAGHVGETAERGGQERLFGVDVESTPITVAVVIASVLVAAAAWWRPRTAVFLFGAAFCLAAAVLDVREFAHQIAENRTGLAVLVGLVAALHLGAGLAGAAAPRATRGVTAA